LGGDCSRFKTTAEKPTARCLSLITPDGERTMRTDLGAAMLLRPEEISPADFDGIRHVHLEGYALLDEALTQAVLDKAREHDCSISLDMGSFEVVRSVGDKLTCWLNEYVDMVFANEEEARAFCSDDNPKVGLDALGSLCRIAVVKVGAQGAWLQENGERVHVPALPVETVVDTTGAGDCWAGGFLYGYLNGLSLAQAGALAAITGAETVKNMGAAPDAAGWKQIREFAKELLP
jgi:sugar/nucleoside kinase (ribokinase family)